MENNQIFLIGHLAPLIGDIKNVDIRIEIQILDCTE